MALLITETFGYATSDNSEKAVAQRKSEICPFLNKTCWKKFRAGGVVNGTCAVKQPKGDEVIICPDRLYAEQFRILREIVIDAFGPEMKLIGPSEIAGTNGEKNRVVAFGKRWGKEIRVPQPGEKGDDKKKKSFSSADWILARVTESGELLEFVPVEVQSMDTSGSYQGLWYEMYGLTLPKGCDPEQPGINWENVNKRILPQLLTKGNVFRREKLCRKGMFFVCPTPVYNALINRLGAKLSQFPMQAGAITFRHYSLSAAAPAGQLRPLAFGGEFTTTIENLRDAFNSTLNLPDMGVVAQKIELELVAATKPKKKKKVTSSGG